MKKKQKINETARRIHLVGDDTPFVVTESFRKIVTNIGFAIPKKEDGVGKIFCVTSAVSGEGKTTVSVNIALTLAKSGAKTILVDCDLRKPSVKRYFPKSGKKGIVAFLSGQTGLDDIIAHDEKTGLDIIATYQSPPNPMSLFNCDEFDKLIESLKYNYEYIVIDTPPVGLVSDASIIGTKTDGVVIVTRSMYSNHRSIKDIIGQFKFSKCNILGFVLNDFALARSGSYGYRYGYGYKYGYGYGEISHKDKAEKTK